MRIPRWIHDPSKSTLSLRERIGEGWEAVKANLGYGPVPTDPEALRQTIADARSSTLAQMAAALSYRTIFSLIPMIVVGLVLLRAFTTNQDVENLLSSAFRYAGLSDISVPEKPEAAPPKWSLIGGLPVAIPQPRAVVAPAVDAHPARLDAFIGDLVKRVSTVPFASIGWIGLAMLIYAAIGMLVEMERSFNQIYRVPVGRSWARRITQYWTVLTLGTGFLAATFFVGEQFKGWAARITEAQGWGAGGVTIGLIGFGITVCISTLLFLLAYCTIPNTRVSLRAALAGAFVAALCWESGKWGFTQYVRMSAASSYGRLYGSLALVPLFLFWVYITWLVTLFGLRVAYYIQHTSRATVARPREAAEPVIVDPSAILTVTVALAERFENGKTASASELSEQLGVQRPVVEQMLACLARGGMVHRLEQETNDEDTDRFALARPPERIMAEDVLALGLDLEGSPAPGPAGRTTETIRQCRIDAMKGRDVASLAGLSDGYHSASTRRSDVGAEGEPGRPATVPSNAAMPRS
ncbi:MAG: YihY family inner membrane protein [Phycisphaerales bacterium]|nr:YihY family inner membrane protein [Phycisphaerales bacterium]